MTWRCFHCDEVFTTTGAAADHFGYTQSADPGCIIDKVAVEEGGKPERGRGLLMALRKAEAELQRYREEDTDLHRELHHKDSEHRQALIREEEKGYRRGLADGHRFPADAAATAGVTEAPAVIQHCQDCGYDNITPNRRNNCPNSGGHELLDGPRPARGVKVCDCERAMVPAGSICSRCGGIGTAGVGVPQAPSFDAWWSAIPQEDLADATFEMLRAWCLSAWKSAAGVAPSEVPRNVTTDEDRWLRAAAKASSKLVAPGKLAAGVPVVDEALLRRAYDQGWINCAAWAERPDLICDCDSAAYDKDRSEAMTRVTAGVSESRGEVSPPAGTDGEPT